MSQSSTQAFLPQSFAKLAYHAFQQGQSYFGLAHKTLSTQFLQWLYPNQAHKPLIPPKILAKVHQRFQAILEVDWQDAAAGIYPIDLLFENDWMEFLRAYPAVCLDLPQSWARAHQKQYQAFDPEIDTTGFPSYYVQNFHHQTDGYLSDRSADLYDPQVDILFSGAANAMRRRVLAPLKQGLQSFQDATPFHILDVACGTGRTLQFLRGTFPKASLYGVDLSPAYLRKANQRLSQIPGELPQLIQANAEALPYQDNYFHGLTCVFLFHELPHAVRQQVIHECFRVTKPGGTFVICDSIQLSDSPDLQSMMENFSANFHEPYYQDYVRDNLVERLESAGFTDIRTEVHFMSKYLIAHKPA